ncbi:MAG: type II toxin-antitoxin system RelE/ParE family toxin [Isosphaeraceae bacterium]
MAGKEPTVARSPEAIQDLIEIADYIAERTGLAASDRFLDAVDRTFRRLAQMPGIGTRWDDEDPELEKVRFFPVTRYRKYLVFYRPLGGGIEVLRVLHGARDLRRILRGGNLAD